MTATEVYNILSKAFSHNLSCAIIGNLIAESNLNPKNLQNSYEAKLGYNDTTYTEAVDSGTYSRTKFMQDAAGYGLAQWTYKSRKAALYDYAKANGKSIGDGELQLDFLIYEMTKSYSGIIARENCADLATLTELVMKGYEAPANQTKAAVNYRIKKAQEAESEIYDSQISDREYYPVPDYTGSSIIDALKAIGVDSSLKNRKVIAAKNAIVPYTGTAAQNKIMLSYLKNGVLIK